MHSSCRVDIAATKDCGSATPRQGSVPWCPVFRGLAAANEVEKALDLAQQFKEQGVALKPATLVALEEWSATAGTCMGFPIPACVPKCIDLVLSIESMQYAN